MDVNLRQERERTTAGDGMPFGLFRGSGGVVEGVAVNGPIPEIPYPPEHLEDLKKLGPLMIASMEKEGLPMQSGQINLGPLEPDVDLAYYYFMWTSEANTVIAHLNMVINDLRSLHKNFETLGGSPWTRYELLMRTYFHEFYRMREILGTFLSAMKDRGHLTKQEVKVARDAFHEAIKHKVELRNAVVHGRPRFTGEEHFNLNLTSIVHNRGQKLVKRDTAEVFSVAAALKAAGEKAADVLERNGKEVVQLMSAFVKDSVAITGGDAGAEYSGIGGQAKG